MRFGRAATAGGDEGFTLVETLVSVAIIAVVMLGVGAAFIATASGTDAAGSRQVAARVATDGLDLVHALGVNGVTTGRGLTSTQTQWTGRPSAVSTLFGTLSMAYDATATADSGKVACTAAVTTSCAALPTTPTAVPVDGVVYNQSFYIASCFLNSAQTCLGGAIAGTVPMDDVVVAVTWKSKACAKNTCSYAVSTLMADTTVDPQFNTNLQVPAPVVSALNVAAMDGTEIVSGLKPVVTSTSTLFYSATGLPTGITVNPQTGELTGTLTNPTAPVTSTVRITVTDAFGQAGFTEFPWIVNPTPKLVNGTAPLLASIDLNSVLAHTGGTGASTWACTGLPLGLTLDATSGVLSGLTSLLTAVKPVCTVTDSRKLSASATLSLTPLPTLTLSTSVLPAMKRSTAYPSLLTLSASGCVLSCTWTNTGLAAAGMKLTASGTTATVSGTTPSATVAKNYPVTITVTDGLGRAMTYTATWKVS